MHGLSTTVILLTLATLLDEILHLANLISLEHISKSRLRYPSHWPTSPHQCPPTIRLWPILSAAASPVEDSEHPSQQEIPSIISHEEQEERRDTRDAQSHATLIQWTVGTTEPDALPTFQRPSEIEEGDLVTPLGSNAPMGWADPRLRGGQMLDFVFPGRGEPLNVIISGLSDPYILTPRGLLHYVQTLGFSTECLGIHLGMLHVANLGDALNPPPNPLGQHPDQGNDDNDNPPRIPPPNQGGNKTEQLLARQNYDWPQHGWPDYGTCLEGLIGGSNFRAWKQDGAGARTGAWFLAAWREMWLGTGHAISPDGYNGGRDGIVKRALKPTRWSPIEEGIWWRTTLKYNYTLIPPGSAGMNHKISQDGRVAILTVRRRDKPPSRRELWDAWRELARTPLTGLVGGGGASWFDWERRAEIGRARWELEGLVLEGDV